MYCCVLKEWETILGRRIVLASSSPRRRELLAHVSHDLRTPLAGMRAYLETLQLKGDDLSESERSDFLDKALLTNKHRQQYHYRGKHRSNA